MTVINVRTDPDTEAALDILTADGTTRSAAIRQAIVAAASEARRQRLRAEAEALRDDPKDREAVRRAQADMDALRAW